MSMPLMDVVCYVGRGIMSKFCNNLEAKVMAYGKLKVSEKGSGYHPKGGMGFPC